MSRGFFGNFLGFLGFFEKVYEIFSTDLLLAPRCEFTQKGYKRVLKSPKTYTFLEFFWENHLTNAIVMDFVPGYNNELQLLVT